MAGAITASAHAAAKRANFIVSPRLVIELRGWISARHRRHGPPGNVAQVNLAGSFIKPEQAHIAIKTLCNVAGDVAPAAKHLNGPVGDPAAHFRSKQLAHRCRSEEHTS